jgi:UDP-glucose 4-epimerase
MRVLITGAFGFIGSYMLGNLLGQGFKVGVIVRNVPAHFKGLAGKVDLYLADVTKKIQINLRKDYDVVIHLAAANDVDSQNALEALKVTTYGTNNFLEFCCQNDLKRFIYFSTFQVYGRESGYVDETTPINCKNNYAITHFFGEEYVKMFHRNYGLQYIIVRPTNIYGKIFHKDLDRWSLVPNCFCKEAYEKATITLLSSGKQVRDFISLEDVANLTSILCKNFDTQKNDVLNIARGKTVSIIQVANMVKAIYEKLFSKKCALEIRAQRPLETEDLQVSIRKIKKLNFSYSKQHTLEHEIEDIFSTIRGR